MEAALLVALGYLSGSVPYGVLVARAKGVDVRTAGSGNIGATNVARTVGKRWGAVVMLLDALKGLGPVLLAAHYFPATQWVPAATAAAAVAGHVWPVWLKFRGGKGVATLVGVFAALAPIPTGAAAAVWLAVYGVTRVSSAASLAAVTTLLGTVWAFGESLPDLLLAALGWIVVMFRHRGNIARLVTGEEKQI